MFSRSALSSCRAHRKVQCLHLASRSLATLTDTASSSSAPPPAPAKATQDGPKPVLNTAVILNRSPMVTRTPTAFERAYYAYHSRIQRALHNPFPTEFYFKQGSLLEGKFNEEERVREKEAFRGPRSSSKSMSQSQSEGESAGAESSELLGQEAPVNPMPRITEADTKGDVKSLDRRGEKNLYLLVLGKDSTGKEVWRFPQGDVLPEELLHEAAQRDLNLECGTSMDTWVVSRNPIGVYQPPQSSQTYTFFYKAHILAGQARPDGKNVLDFAWLTKEEIAPRVEKDYWTGVKDMLSDF